MSTATDYRTRELAKRYRQADRRKGRMSKNAEQSTFRIGLEIGLTASKGKK